MTDTTTQLNLEDLRAMLAAASPDPWVAVRFRHDERGDDMTASEAAEYLRATLEKSEAESGSTEFMAIVCQKPDGPADVCHFGNGPTRHANSRLVETLRNPAHGLDLAALQRLKTAIAAIGPN